ncbi:MAG: AAA-like domain-containing protein [Candidatus Aminicenantes bacterium]|nr:MAG: AAA-like domain-containing protein [Candidatus Aminicenantes bacterium]
MRRFTSYGPINPNLHYYAPRKELIDRAYTQLVGEEPAEGGHYITVWAPRQCGKTWIMQEVVEKIKQTNDYEIGLISMEPAKEEKEEKEVLDVLIQKLQIVFSRSFPVIEKIKQVPTLFTRKYFQKPVILILDEFDALEEVFINRFASIFRDIYISRTGERDKPGKDKANLLHGLALVGVRSVLGIENVKGSPFNVQRSLHIPNLTDDEVKGMFRWYEKESGQKVQQDVVERLFYETNGQPGLTCWFGELLTATYNKGKKVPINMGHFKYVYKEATHVLPNNNILNIISKVNQQPYKEEVLELFKTDKKIEFRFDDKNLNYLYMNGVIDIEREENEKGESEVYCKFANPFVQTRLFSYFSREMFDDLGLLIHPLDSMEDAISEDSLIIPNILKRYKAYLKKNRDMVFKGMPRRKIDKRLYEAVYHFNLYRYLYDLLKKRGVDVIPEFPTGNGKIDLILKYRERVYALELKSFRDMYDYGRGIERAADYGKQLGLKEIVLLVFVELKEEEVKELDQEIEKPGIKVIVIPIGVL